MKNYLLAACATFALLAGCSSETGASDSTDTDTAALAGDVCAATNTDHEIPWLSDGECPTTGPVSSPDENYWHNGCGREYIIDVGEVPGDTFWVNRVQPLEAHREADCEHAHGVYRVIGYDAAGNAHNVPLAGVSYPPGSVVPFASYQFNQKYSPCSGGFCGGCYLDTPSGQRQFTLNGPEGRLLHARIIVHAEDDRDPGIFYPVETWVNKVPQWCVH